MNFAQFRLSIAFFSSVMLCAGSAFAGPVNIPTTFTSGTPAVASEVNGNFTAVKSAVDDNNTRINTNLTTNNSQNTRLNNLENPSGAVSVAGLAFTDESGGAAGCQTERNTEVYFRFAGAGGNCDAMAPIQLPQGDTVTSLSCTILDNNAAGAAQIAVQLRRIAFSNGVASTIFTTPNSVDSVSVAQYADATATAGTAVIDNNTYSYALKADFGTPVPGASMRLYGCKVTH